MLELEPEPKLPSKHDWLNEVTAEVLEKIGPFNLSRHCPELTNQDDEK